MRKVLHLLGVLTDGDLDWLLRHGHTRFVPRDTVVIREGEPIEHLFILVEGTLSVRRADLGSREIATLHPGEVLGEISLVDGRAPSASVVSVQDSHLFEISRNALKDQLLRSDAFAARFYRALAVFLADRLRTTTSHLGYGKWQPDPDTDEIEESRFDDIALAARRFDDMLRRLRVN
jgi:CRP/FNR family transcriptional regulator, cyclic AMP receptor protein